jgi:hypothetical protein
MRSARFVGLNGCASTACAVDVKRKSKYIRVRFMNNVNSAVEEPSMTYVAQLTYFQNMLNIAQNTSGLSMTALAVSNNMVM